MCVRISFPREGVGGEFTSPPPSLHPKQIFSNLIETKRPDKIDNYQVKKQRYKKFISPTPACKSTPKIYTIPLEGSFFG